MADRPHPFLTDLIANLAQAMGAVTISSRVAAQNSKEAKEAAQQAARAKGGGGRNLGGFDVLSGRVAGDNNAKNITRMLREGAVGQFDDAGNLADSGPDYQLADDTGAKKPYTIGDVTRSYKNKQASKRYAEAVRLGQGKPGSNFSSMEGDSKREQSQAEADRAARMEAFRQEAEERFSKTGRYDVAKKSWGQKISGLFGGAGGSGAGAGAAGEAAGGGMGALGGIAMGAGAITTLGVAVISVTKMLHGWANELVESKQEMAQFNGTIGNAYANFQRSQQLLLVKSGKQEGASTKSLMEATAQTNEILQPLASDMSILKNKAYEGFEIALRHTVEMFASLPVMKKLDEWINKALGGDTDDTGPIVRALQDFALRKEDVDFWKMQAKERFSEIKNHGVPKPLGDNRRLPQK